MMREKPKDKETLLRLLQDKTTRNDAFEYLVDEHQQRIYQHIRRMVVQHDDAADLLQNTFVKAFTSLDSFRSEASLLTWLLKIATNECLMFLRSKRLRQWLRIGETHVESTSVATGFDEDEALRWFYEAIETLTPMQKAVFNLKYFENLSYEEIERLLGSKNGTLKATYFNAVKRIEAKLKSKTIL